MSEPFVGEIRMFGGNFAPFGWAFCDGQVQSIAQNDVLYSLIGTTYGGDGVNTFNLPDLRGRVPIHQGFFAGGGGGTFVIGQSAGSESITLISQQLPSHTHQLFAASSGQVQVPASNTLLASTVPSTDHVYGPATAINTQLAAGSISAAGGSQPHENRQPFLAINFIISLFGIYPSRN